MAPIGVNLRDLTVLAGPNSAGKSTVVQPLLLIKQTIEKPFDPGGLAIDGPLVKFTSTDQFLSGSLRREGDDALKIALATDDHETELTYRKSADGILVPVEQHFTRGKEHVTWTPGQELTAAEAAGDDKKRQSFYNQLPNGPFRIVRILCWLAARGNISGTPAAVLEMPLKYTAGPAIKGIIGMIHLPGLRGNPERDYSITAIGNEFPGAFTRYVASIVHFWGRTERPKLKKLADHLKKLNLTGNIGTRHLDDTRIEIRVGRLPVRARGGADDTVSIADVGVGVSQILPVLVALLVANKDQIVCIEQPEIHLHPRAQIALAEVILEAADRGVRVIIETHSSLLLLAIQSLVSEGKLAPERVSLNWFTRDAGGQTHVSEAVLAADGSYGDWPEDFGSVEMKLQNRYLDAASRHRASERNVA